MGESSPSPTGDNGGRSAAGRFTPGNRFGRGNPLNARAQQIRAALLERLTPEAAGEIADRLIAQAKGGDLPSIRELLDRTVGKACQMELLERIAAIEQQLEEK